MLPSDRFRNRLISSKISTQRFIFTQWDRTKFKRMLWPMKDSLLCYVISSSLVSNTCRWNGTFLSIIMYTSSCWKITPSMFRSFSILVYFAMWNETIHFQSYRYLHEQLSIELLAIFLEFPSIWRFLNLQLESQHRSSEWCSVFIFDFGNRQLVLQKKSSFKRLYIFKGPPLSLWKWNFPARLVR